MFRIMPIKENESKNRYYKRLIESEAVKRSRTTLQLCESAVKAAPDNIDAAYEAYCKLSNDRQMKKQEAKAKQISVKAVCPQEDVASQCDEVMEEPEETLKRCEEYDNSELTAKDKKELAMYAIDQHYFFLKQLTGVI